MSTRPAWIARLVALDACEEAIQWASAYTTLEDAWKACERPDWMFWLLGRCKDVDHRKLVLVACEIARNVLHLVPAGDDIPRVAIETAEAWTMGEASIEQVRTARRAAAKAAYAAADAADAAYAAYAAADAAADAAAYAADAAYAAADAAAGARTAARLTNCTIIRKHFPLSPTLP